MHIIFIKGFRNFTAEAYYSINTNMIVFIEKNNNKKTNESVLSRTL